ncbi:unnamed protein product [Mucor fragilis]
MNSHSASPTPTRKRTHLKPSQVATLQDSFDTNPLPDSSVRSRLARELAVTERTIQIWFQNRRAKARKVEALGAFPSNSSSSTSSSSTVIRPGSGASSNGWVDPHRHATPPRYQATFRTMMTPERFEELKHQDHQQIRKRPRSSSKPEPKSSHLLELTRSDNLRAMSEGISRPNHNVLFSATASTSTPTTSASLSSTPTSAGTVVHGGATASTITNESQMGLITDTPIQTVPLPVSVLRIGSWTRFAHASPHLHQRDWDLVCYASPLDRELVWRVQAEGHHFRIQVSFDSIHQLRLSRQVQVETGELVGQLDIELSLPLAFSMWRFGQDHQWVRCGDFTEDKQASVDGFHILQGNHEAFKQALLDLLALAPELATKISVTPTANTMMMDLHQPPPPGLDLCRDFTMSPSATPEPSSLAAAAAAAQAVAAQQMMYHGNNGLSAYGMINPQQLSKANMSHLMLQAPFFYPTTATPQTQGNTVPPHHQQHHQEQQSNEDLYQMLIHQQHAQPSSLLL